MRRFQPMPENPLHQEKVHAIVPRQVKERFMAALPWQGAQQYAIRLVFEVLPEMVSRDDLFATFFMEEMKQMYSEDRARWEAKQRPVVDRRQMDIPFPEELEG